MVRVVALVVDWSTPGDVMKLIDSAGIHEPEVPWVIWRNFHPQHSRDVYVFKHLPTLQVVHANKNLGHGAGINRAAVLAQEKWDPEYFFVVNPDCEFRIPIIDRLVEFLEYNPQAWIVGPKQLDSKMRITAAGIFGTPRKPTHRMWHIPDPGNTLARDTQEAIMAAGSGFLISVAHFNLLGGLLEATHYYSDTWIAYHARAHGGQVWYKGDTWMIHEWHRSSPKGFDGTDGNFKKDQELFRKMCREHDPPIECE